MNTYWLELAESAPEEGQSIDFKAECRISKPGFWCELIKDLVAFANTNGGIIVFGANSDGQPTDGDCADLETLDNADILNQIFKYTGVQLQNIQKTQIQRGANVHWAITIERESTLIPFTKPGTYEIEDGKQKNAFSVGTIYVRHGSKSAPCNRDDLRAWLDRELKVIRTSWLKNIRSVIEAPPQEKVTVVVGAQANAGSSNVVHAKFSQSDDAIPVTVQDPSETWPYRSKELIEAVSKRLSGQKFNTHDIVALKFVHNINEKTRPEFVHRSHPMAGPLYSTEFEDWIVNSWTADNNFFFSARIEWKNANFGR